MERSGHPLKRLARRFVDAYRKGEFYKPGPEIIARSSKDDSEMWIVADGPKGRATAVVILVHEELVVITIRESESCQQGEASLRKSSGHFPFKELLGGPVP